MATPLLKFNSYVFDKTFKYELLPLSRASSVLRRANEHGAVIRAENFGDRRVTLSGTLYGEYQDVINPENTPLRDKWDTLAEAVFAGAGKLYINADRFFREAVCIDGPRSYTENSAERFADVNLQFAIGDPFLYAETEDESETNAIGSSPDTVTLTPSGGSARAFARPRYEIEIDTGGTLALTVNNDRDDRAFTYGGAVSNGDVITVDAYERRVLLNGSDALAQFGGMLPRLYTGANDIQLTFTGATIANFAAYWRPTWI